MNITKPSIPFMKKIVEEFYNLNGNCVGGNLHIVLDDINVGDDTILWCLDRCIVQSDLDGAFLCELLLQYTEDQREEIVG